MAMLEAQLLGLFLQQTIQHLRPVMLQTTQGQKI
jgi:hypothetical protein